LHPMPLRNSVMSQREVQFLSRYCHLFIALARISHM
jgi:hypothetical protein